MLRAKILANGARRRYLKKKTYFETDIGAKLPESYKKFFAEWKEEKAKPVHFIEKQGRYKLNEKGRVVSVTNVPIPNKFTLEQDQGIWGGESVIEGYRLPAHQFETYVPDYWIPRLLDQIIYSEILDKYLNVTVTQRTIDLIHQHYGFDTYILETKACDLNSLLACKIKRKMLLALHNKSLYPDDPSKRDSIYAKYQKYLEGFSREDIEWYGYSIPEAEEKFLALDKEEQDKAKVPLKIVYRQQMLEELKQMKLDGILDKDSEKKDTSFLQKFNPFAKST